MGRGGGGVGQLDGGDEPVAEQFGEAPFEDDGDGGVGEVGEQPGEHLQGEEADNGQRPAPSSTTEAKAPGQFLHPVHQEQP